MVVLLRVWVILIRGFDDSGLSVFACDVSDKQYNAIWCHNKFGKNISKMEVVVDFNFLK